MNRFLLSLVLATIALGAPTARAATTTVEGEAMSLPSSAGTVFSDADASGGKAVLVWSNGSATTKVTTTGAQRLVVAARGDQCDGAPHMVVSIDGATVLSQDVPAKSWTDYVAPVSLSDASHSVRVAFTNDHLGAGCDRNLRVDKLALAPASAVSPLAGKKLFVDPSSNAALQASAWRQTRPGDAAEMDKIAAQSQADWFGDWSGDVKTAVSDRVTQITSAGALPVLVAYDIPLRDCGSYSSGGATSPSAYKTWIRAFADGIGSRRAVVILEPDALAGMDCLSPADQSTRLSLLHDAVGVLAGHSGVSTYIDAGHSGWQTASEMAARLSKAGVANARGFSLNISNYLTTASQQAYGDQISPLIGWKRYVVDTSRNGLGPAPDGSWCNASGRALGARPTAATTDVLADAYLWIKRPGESDGTCNGGPAAGAWWADYALGLAQRAAY